MAVLYATQLHEYVDGTRQHCITQMSTCRELSKVHTGASSHPAHPAAWSFTRHAWGIASRCAAAQLLQILETLHTAARSCYSNQGCSSMQPVTAGNIVMCVIVGVMSWWLARRYASRLLPLLFACPLPKLACTAAWQVEPLTYTYTHLSLPSQPWAYRHFRDWPGICQGCTTATLGLCAEHDVPTQVTVHVEPTAAAACT